MAINLQIFLGTVNYTDYLHVTAAKVVSPSTVVWEDWIPVPVTNYTIVIPGLDPDDYYISFYDAPDNVSLGTLVSQCFVNARSPEYAYEIRFYEIGNLPSGATLDVTETIINDPYLVGKTIESFFKEGFRFLDDTEIDFDNATGDMELLTGGNFETGEKFTITIKYAVGTVPASTGGGLYSGTIDVTDATYTMLTTDKNKRVRLKGAAATQVITLPVLSALTVDDGYYFDNSVGGTANQVKLLIQGGDRIYYNGFMAASDEFEEFWVSKGQHLLIKKYDDNFYEIITDFKGVCVGEKITLGYKSHPLVITENGQLMDGDEWPLMWWWLNNILPSTHKYTTDTVTGSFTADATKPGQFALHSTLKKWRMPSTIALTEKGLANFETYGTDTTNRPVDYPGGFQEQAVLEHGHSIKSTNSGASSNQNVDVIRGNLLGDVATRGQAGANKTIGLTGNAEQRNKNIGVIYARRMG